MFKNPLDQFVPEDFRKKAESNRREKRHEERLYFMREELQDGTLGRVKIGISKSPGYRRRKLQTGNPDKIVIVGSIRGGEAEEIKLHSILAPWRGLGEWFDPSDEVLNIMRRVIDVGSISGASLHQYDRRFDMMSMMKKGSHEEGCEEAKDESNR